MSNRAPLLYLLLASTVAASLSASTLGCLAEGEDAASSGYPDSEPATSATDQELSASGFSFRSVPFKDLQVVAVPVSQNFLCQTGWSYYTTYQLHYPVCTAPLPGHCVDTYKVQHKCVNGSFQVVANTLVSHVCDYDYDGTSCEPIELPY